MYTKSRLLQIWIISVTSHQLHKVEATYKRLSLHIADLRFQINRDANFISLIALKLYCVYLVRHYIFTVKL